MKKNCDGIECCYRREASQQQRLKLALKQFAGHSMKMPELCTAPANGGERTCLFCVAGAFKMHDSPAKWDYATF